MLLAGLSSHSRSDTPTPAVTRLPIIDTANGLDISVTLGGLPALLKKNCW